MSSPLERFRDEVGDAYVLGPVRVAIGALLGFHALAAAEELATRGYFGDAYHIAMVPESFVPSGKVYAALLTLRVCLAVLVFVGIRARPALAASSLLGLFCIFLDRNQFHHNRYSLFLYAFLLAFTPCDRSWRTAVTLQPRSGPFWAVRLTQIQVSLVYLASGGSKLLDPDWRDGLVLGDRFLRYGPVAVGYGVPRKVIDWLSNPDAASAMAKLAIMTELVLCVALWLGPTRIIALWWGIWFHITIQVTSKVETFSILAVVMYGMFVTSDYQARTIRFDPSRFWGRLAGTIVPALDWFARFKVEPWEPDEKGGHSVVVIRRDGERATGIRAFAMMTRCLPLLFAIWGPVALYASFTKRGDLTTGG